MALASKLVDYDEELTSGILPMIYEMIRGRPGCDVVDLGAASTDNLMLFSRNGARVYIDTSSRSLRSDIALSRTPTAKDLDKLLAYCEGIDVLILWNVLDYLLLGTVEQLMQRISAVMRPGGLLYAMVSHKRYIPVLPALIDIIADDRLRFRHGPLELEGPHYAPKQLEQRMPGFRIEKLYLLQNGTQEHLFLFEGLD